MPTSGISSSAETSVPTRQPAVEIAYRRPATVPASSTVRHRRAGSRTGDTAPSSSTGTATSTEHAEQRADEGAGRDRVERVDRHVEQRVGDERHERQQARRRSARAGRGRACAGGGRPAARRASSRRDSATSTTPIVFAHTIVDAPKYGASSRTAAISAPSEPVPTTNTSSGSGGIADRNARRRPRREPLGATSPPARPPTARTSGIRSPSSGAGATRTPLIVERAEGTDADRHRRPPLHRRRLVALVQRPRPPPPAHRRRGPRAARPRRALDDARPLAPGRRSSWRERLVEIAPAGAHPRLLLRQRLDRRRGRAQDGVPVLAARRGERARARASSACATPTTATRSARCRSAASTSSTRCTARCCSTRCKAEPGRRSTSMRAAARRARRARSPP